MRKIICKMMIVSLVASLACVACGKSNKDKKSMNMSKSANEKIKMYYVSDDLKETKSYDVEISDKTVDVNGIINDVLEKMKKGNEHAKNPTITAGIKLVTYNTSSNLVQINFDDTYDKSDPTAELLRRAAIVCTLCQIDKVDYVAFYVNNQILKINGDKCENMSAESFINDIGSNDKVKIPLKLYFTSSKGDKLVPVNEDVDYGKDNTNKAELIVKELIEGPKEVGYYRTLPKDVVCNRVSIDNKVCYVDFNDKFGNKCKGVTDAVAVYSIVNSLAALDEIEEVKISVNGDVLEYYNNNSKGVKLNEPLRRNYDIADESDAME